MTNEEIQTTQPSVNGDATPAVESPVAVSGTVENPRKRAALAYAKRGWRVFPLHSIAQEKLCTCGKSNCTSPGKHPRTAHGVLDATLDPAAIEGWWTMWPDANVGIATGKVSGLVVLDFDPRHGGFESLSEIVRQHGPFSPTAEVETGGGGKHFFFRYPEGEKTISSGVRVGGFSGVDVRGDGGFVVAAPSLHISGKDYQWEAGQNPEEIALAPIPLALIDLLNKGAERVKNEPGWIQKTLSELSEGRRNEGFTKIIGRFHADGHLSNDIVAILRPHAELVQFPLSELQAITDGIERRYPNGDGADSMDRWEPVPVTALQEAEPVTFVWDQHLPEEGTTLFCGLWKCGKTTFVADFLSKTKVGGVHLEHAVKAVKVLVISEESQGVWQQRRDQFGLGDNVHLICRPFLGKPSWKTYGQFILHVEELIRREGYKLVILDPFASLSPVINENDASETIRALAPLNRWTILKLALWILHHPKKGDAGEGQAGRGSGALMGFVDNILEIRRYDASRREDTRRVLTSYSRYDGTPPEVVVDLVDGHYELVGTKGTARASDRWTIIRGLLPHEPPGIEIKEIKAHWPEDVVSPAVRTIEDTISWAFGEGKVQRGGKGKKGDPFTYWIPDGAAKVNSNPPSKEVESVGKEIEPMSSSCPPQAKPINSFPASPASIAEGKVSVEALAPKKKRRSILTAPGSIAGEKESGDQIEDGIIVTPPNPEGQFDLCLPDTAQLPSTFQGGSGETAA